MTRFNQAADITPSDTVDILLPGHAGQQRPFPDAIYVGGDGVVAAVLENGMVVNFSCVIGQILPVGVRRVNATNTTATLLKALWTR